MSGLPGRRGPLDWRSKVLRRLAAATVLAGLFHAILFLMIDLFAPRVETLSTGAPIEISMVSAASMGISETPHRPAVHESPPPTAPVSRAERSSRNEPAFAASSPPLADDANTPPTAPTPAATSATLQETPAAAAQDVESVVRQILGDRAREAEGTDATPPPPSAAGGAISAARQQEEACQISQEVQRTLVADPDAVEAVARIPPQSRSVAGAVPVWNQQWADAAALGGDGATSALRTVVRNVVQAAPSACRDLVISGPRFVTVPQGAGTTVLVFGSGDWRWADTTAADVDWDYVLPW